VNTIYNSSEQVLAIDRPGLSAHPFKLVKQRWNGDRLEKNAIAMDLEGVRAFGATRYDEYTNVTHGRMIPNPSTQLATVAVRHLKIGNDDVGRAAEEHLPRIMAIAGLEHYVPLARHQIS
jgi:hypothetical protein